MILWKVGHLDVPVLLFINKIDLSNQEKLVELVEAWKELLPKAEIIPISATSKFNGLCHEAGEGACCRLSPISTRTVDGQAGAFLRDRNNP